MKITFQNLNVQEADKTYGDRTKASQKEEAYQTVSEGVLWQAGQDWMLNMAGGSEKGKTLVELQQEAGNSNAAVQQDYMTIMSHTMSEEDYAKLAEEGFHFAGLDPETAVTIVDKIKAELARSGQQIIGYTDDLDMETLAAAVGSDTLARSIAEQFQASDIPMTAANLAEVKSAWEMASKLQTPEDGTKSYLIDNELEPAIWNLYVAQNSGAGSGISPAARMYAEEVPGYYTKSAGEGARENLQKQIDQILEEAGLTVDAGNRQRADWLLAADLPLTGESLNRLKSLEEITFPVNEEVFTQAAAAAILEGKSPMQANLAQTETIYQKAVRLEETYFSEEKWLSTEGNLTARKQLEEIRLRMTAEVNVKLLQSDFSIDTAPMEQLIEALRKAEEQVAARYFPKEQDAVGKYETYQQALRVTEDLPGLPAAMMGSFSLRELPGTVEQFHQEGVSLQTAYNRAQESYETMMTSPRSDLGDSIRKAFSNVEDILKELSLDNSWENQRAARILGYNRMEITEEAVCRVRLADEQVRSVIEKMTPRAVWQMVQDGVNPLKQTFEQLEEYFQSLPEDYQETAESYSRFLYQLEQQKDITEAQRQSYIGIYRLVHQVEQADGAAVGAVLNSQAQLQFANLLSAVRSRHFRHFDVRATEETGLTKELVQKGSSIPDQIAGGILETAKTILTEVSDNSEAAAAYDREILQQLRKTAEVQPEAVALLQKSGLTASAENLLAAQALRQDSASFFRTWKEKKEQASLLRDKLDQKEEFQDTYQQLVEETAQETEADSLNRADTSLDVRQLQLLHKQLSVMGSLAQAEEYIFPMYIGEELTRVHLTLEQGTEQQGSVDIVVDWSLGEQLEAHLQLTDSHIGGYLVGNTPEEVTKLQQVSDIFLEWIQEEASAGWKADTLPVVNSQGKARMAAWETKKAEKAGTRTDNEELYRLAKGFLQAVDREVALRRNED